MTQHRAAQYLRMSTEHQRYSLSNQSSEIASFASVHGLDVIATYSDPGCSGLSIRSRPGLRSLLAEVTSGKADFDTILVLDVSRWGRFQNPDEAAHYEFVCRSSGVRVLYCDEAFGTSPAPVEGLVKQLKRVMAAEFSRQVGEGVRRSKIVAHRTGYRGGGPAPYGFRRQVVSESGTDLQVLQFGQRRVIRSQRVRLVHGPHDEIAAIKRIFKLRGLENLNVRSIAKRMNDQPRSSTHGAVWSESRVRAVLRNEQVLGIQIWGRHWCRLTSRGRRPPEDWVRTTVLPPIIPRWLFMLAQNAGRKSPDQTVEELAEQLRLLWASSGALSATLIEASAELPGPRYLYRRFGGKEKMYRRIGYPMFSLNAQRLAFLIAKHRLNAQ